MSDEGPSDDRETGVRLLRGALNGAVNQMDYATRQDVPLIELSTAASHNLATKANERARQFATGAGQIAVMHDPAPARVMRAPSKATVMRSGTSRRLRRPSYG